MFQERTLKLDILKQIREQKQNPKQKKLYAGMEGKILMFYGSNNLGKTFQACSFDPNKTLVLATENGVNAISLGIDPVLIEDAGEFRRIVLQLVDRKNRKELLESITYVVIDSVDRITALFETYVIKKYNSDNFSKPDFVPITHISDIPYGGGYSEVNRTVSELMNSLTMAGYCVIFIDHDETNEKYKDKNTGEEYSYTFPRNTSSKSGSIFRDLPDWVFYLTAGGFDERGIEKPSSAYCIRRKHVFARSRYPESAPFIEVFSAENVKKLVKDAVEKRAEKIGAVVVDSFYDTIEIKTTEQIKAEKEAERKETVEKITAYSKTLYKNFPEDTLKIITSHLGEGKVDEVPVERLSDLKKTLDDLMFFANEKGVEV